MNSKRVRESEFQMKTNGPKIDKNGTYKKWNAR